MSALLLAPHHDDETLFAAFICQTYKPLVVTVLDSTEERRAETLAATRILGCDWMQWPENDVDPDWEAVRAMLVNLDSGNRDHHVFAPYPEPPHGHEQHDVIGQLALEVFGVDRVTWYTTYRFGGPRTTAGAPVGYSGEMLLAKLRALACYESQILNGPKRFFAMPLDEYVVKP